MFSWHSIAALLGYILGDFGAGASKSEAHFYLEGVSAVACGWSGNNGAEIGA
jgi:hypothetical protein